MLVVGKSRFLEAFQILIVKNSRYAKLIQDFQLDDTNPKTQDRLDIVSLFGAHNRSLERWLQLHLLG